MQYGKIFLETKIYPVRDFVMYYTYVIQSKKDNKWYTGATDDLRKRFKEHQEGKSTYTKGRGPFELIYYEGCLNKQDGYAREKYLKSGMGRRYLKNRMKFFFFSRFVTGSTHSMSLY